MDKNEAADQTTGGLRTGAGKDLNPRASGYAPDELPDSSFKYGYSPPRSDSISLHRAGDSISSEYWRTRGKIRDGLEYSVIARARHIALGSLSTFASVLHRLDALGEPAGVH